MGYDFIDLARQGKNQWWRWVLGVCVVLVAWVGSGFSLGMVLVFWVILDNDPNTYIDAATKSIKGLDPIISYIAFNLGHAIMVVVLFLVIRYVHKRQFLSLITPRDRIRWDGMAGSFVLWFGLCAVTTLIDYALHPSTYKLTLHPLRFLIFVPIALVLTPLQTTAEELFLSRVHHARAGTFHAKYLHSCNDHRAALHGATPDQPGGGVGIHPHGRILFRRGFLSRVCHVEEQQSGIRIRDPRCHVSVLRVVHQL